MVSKLDASESSWFEGNKNGLQLIVRFWLIIFDFRNINKYVATTVPSMFTVKQCMDNTEMNISSLTFIL